MKPLYPAMMLLAFTLTAHAAFLSPADRDSIEQQQQLLRQNQQRESLDRAIPLPRTTLPTAPDAMKGPCFTINRIVLDGANLIDARKQQKLVAPWLSQCLDMARI